MATRPRSPRGCSSWPAIRGWWSGSAEGPAHSRRVCPGTTPPARRKRICSASSLREGKADPVMPPKVRDMLERKGDLLQLEALTGDVGLDRLMTTPEASSPGLVLAGYTARFAQNRIHVLGQTEISYLASLDPAARRHSLETLFGFDVP